MSGARREDHRLLTGRGTYVSNRQPSRALHAVFVRSLEAHAELRGVGTAAALALPGVAAVLTADDLTALGASGMPCSWITEGQAMTAVPLLAQEAVWYAGQPVAVVVAEDPALAEDAAELVTLDLVPRPPVLDPLAALAPAAPLLHPEWGSNLVAEIAVGGGDVEAGFARADVTAAVQVRLPRQSAAPMEARAAVAEPAADGRVVAYLSTQAAHHAQAGICATLGWPTARLRVVCPDVGGSFGQKEYISPEDAVVCLLAAHLGRPVRWVEGRADNLAGANHARDSIIDLEVAADDEGRLLAVRGTWIWDVGGHPSSHGLGPARVGAAVMTGPYRVAACSVLIRGVATTKAPIGGYRGYGAPQAHLALERALDALAAAAGLTPDALRRRNLLTAEELPCPMPSGVRLDSGDYRAAYERVFAATNAIEVDGDDEHVIGRGVVPYMMVSAIGPSKGAGPAGLDHGSFETAHVRLARDGCLDVRIGTSAQGQGHETTFAAVAARELGVDPATVSVIGGDTQASPYSPVSAVGSRGAAVVAGAIRAACAQLGARLRQQAAHRLGVANADAISLAGGHATVRDGDGPAVPIAVLAEDLHLGFDLAPGLDLGGGEAVATVDPSTTAVTFGAHGVVVAVDAEAGDVTVLRYVALDDCGPRLDPRIVEGQLRGGIAQGIGTALLEELVYGDDGRLETTGFDGYLLPVARSVPPIDFLVSETPSPDLPGGAKGAGEAGVFGAPAAIAQALDDALGRPAHALCVLPLTRERVLALVPGEAPARA